MISWNFSYTFENMNQAALSEMASIQTGVYARTGPHGDFIYLQAKYFTETGDWISSNLPDLKLTKQIQKHLLQAGDILFAAKGTKNFAACYKEAYGPCVASSTFFVIRIQDKLKNKLLPEYLTWYINHPNTQKWLKGKAIGTALPSISKPVLKELLIPVPSTGKQELILTIQTLRKKETGIQKRINELREQLIQHRLTSIFN